MFLTLPELWRNGVRCVCVCVNVLAGVGVGGGGRGTGGGGGRDDGRKAYQIVCS